MRYLSVVVAIVGMFSFVGACTAQMSSSNFQIQWDSIGSGGSETSSSASFQLHDAIGGNAQGNSSSTSFDTIAGYQAGVDESLLSFTVASESVSTERVVTNLVGTTITTDTTGLSEGDYVVLIQDEGASQISAVGVIESIGVGTITVDSLTDGGVAPVIDGTNDVLYVLSGTAANLGTISASAVSTTVVGFIVTANVPNGYTVQVVDDGNLRNGANDINDVADGSVTAGSEEYGGRSSDTSVTGSTFDTQDTAFTTSFTPVTDRSSAAFDSRDFVTLKASISGSTVNASYAHVLSFILSGNF